MEGCVSLLIDRVELGDRISKQDEEGSQGPELGDEMKRSFIRALVQDCVRLRSMSVTQLQVLFIVFLDEVLDADALPPVLEMLFDA